MKKNISINIGGIIFHVEEDGYESLKIYLDKINKYFADFQDSQEIISDIENRIAEIFLSKLKDEKQVISNSDIESLIATLGSVEDFKEAEKENDLNEEQFESAQDYSSNPEDAKKLYRDTKNKVFGGVAAGLAHYFKIDTIWIRLTLVIMTAFTIFIGAGLLLIIAYMLCWIFLPADPFLNQDDQIKKLYRSKDNYVIAGVAKGLATYFGVEVAIIRLLFVGLIFLGGTGFFAYIVLWLITPKANSLTEKMQMEGTPITLENIEKNIKQNFNMKDGEESLLVRILLFPFRLAAIILGGLAKILGPILNVVVDIIRVILGIILISSGLFLGALAIGIALFNQGWLLPTDLVYALDIPYQLIVNSISIEFTIVSFLLLCIPSIFIMIAGISVIAKRWVLNKTFGLTLLGMYFLSLIAAAVIAFNIAIAFNKENTLKETTAYKVQDSSMLILKTSMVGFENYDEPSITLYGYDGNTVELEKLITARGISTEDCLEKAKMVIHEVSFSADSILDFDSHLRFTDKAVFRAQELDMNLRIPYGQKFQMEPGMRDILKNTIYRNGYNDYQIPNNVWVFTQEGLKCLSCKPNSPSSLRSADNQILEYSDSYEAFEIKERRFLNNKDFNEISIATGILSEVIYDNEYSIEVLSETNDLSDLEVEQYGSTLKIYYDKDLDIWESRPKIKVIIRTPELSKLKASSASIVHLLNFSQDKLTIDASSSAKVHIKGSYDKLYLDASSTAKIYATGETNYLEADASSAAKINTSKMIARNVNAESSSASFISLYASESLTAKASSAGTITYKGSPKLTANSSSGGRIEND